MDEELYLEPEDKEWPFTCTDHDRNIAGGTVFDDSGNFYFVRDERDGREYNGQR